MTFACAFRAYRRLSPSSVSTPALHSGNMVAAGRSVAREGRAADRKSLHNNAGTTNPEYPYYGGRGIRVCDRWLIKGGQGFKHFLDDMGPRPQFKTLDRVNPQGHYEPTNCRWADAKVQANNQGRFIWRHCDPPPVEDVNAMEVRDWKSMRRRTKLGLSVEGLPGSKTLPEDLKCCRGIIPASREGAFLRRDTPYPPISARF